MKKLLFLLVILSSCGKTIASPIAVTTSAGEGQCSREKSTFDGIGQLHYESVLGNAGERISIYPIDPTTCSETDQASCKPKGYLIPGDKVGVSSSCGPWTQIQYIGKKVVVQGWIKSERLTPQDQNKESSSASNLSTFPGPSRYIFRMVKGNGIPVCHAYLQRLNKSFFEQQPKCGRPENDEVPGFQKLKRVPLKPEEIQALIGNVDGFMLGRQQNQSDLVYGRDENGKMGMVSAWPLRSITDTLDLHVWRYSPEVDIDNDGKPDNIVVWHGIGADDRDVMCGEVYANIPDDGSIMQFVYFLDNENKHIDEANTRKLFEGKPHSVIVDSKPFIDRKFPVIDVGIGIFQFDGQYYFDGFEFIADEIGKTSVGDLQVHLEKDGQRTLTCQYKLDGLLH